MKIIDLLVKIATDEEVPEYIENYNRNSDKKDIMLVCKENIIYKLDQLEILLNDEVKVIEDKPEKIENIGIGEDMISFDDKYQDKYFHGSAEILISVCIKINEVIDKLNYLLEKSDKDE